MEYKAIVYYHEGQIRIKLIVPQWIVDEMEGKVFSIAISGNNLSKDQFNMSSITLQEGQTILSLRYIVDEESTDD